jgi:hypothetical protein
MKSRVDLPHFLNRCGLIGCGVEVGVCQGSFSECILESWYGNGLYSIDPWVEQVGVKLDVSNCTQSEHNENLAICRERLKPFKSRSTILREYSVPASARFIANSLDFVYIDARHDYRSVSEDLRAWWPKVAVGGVFSGHDYKNSFVRGNLVEVKRAVDNFAYEFGLVVNTTTDDNLPTWYIIKG